MAKDFRKTSQSYKHRKATWWMGSHLEYYTITNVELTNHNATDELQLENSSETIQGFKDPHIEQTRGASTETLTKSLGESTPGHCTTTSPYFSEWKLVTKKISGVDTIPWESGGYKGTQLSFGTLKFPALNKATCSSLEKSGLTKTSRNTWIKKDGENKVE